MLITTFHPTKFMIDLECTKGKPVSLQDFMKKEKDYDLSFIRALWEVAANQKSKFTPTSLLSLLDKIQSLAIKHLPEKLYVRPHQYRLLHGRARGPYNYYGISKNCNSDLEGIKTLIAEIWIEKKDKVLKITPTKDLDNRYYVTSKEFYLEGDSKHWTIIKNDPSTSKDSINQIYKISLPLFEAGLCPDGNDRMMLYRYTPPQTREKEALEIFNTYLQKIQKAASDLEKIKIICITIRDLMQLHLYNDGNGRALYLLANLLLSANNLGLFYPRNMCMFDANSLSRMVDEILSGQKRFSEMFGSQSNLIAGLKTYHTAVTELKKMISKIDNEKIETAFKERNFSFMLRLAAADEKHLKLLEYLLNKIKDLNINIFEKGKTSGTALNIAEKFKNAKAIELLKGYMKNEDLLPRPLNRHSIPILSYCISFLDPKDQAACKSVSKLWLAAAQ